MEWDPSEEAFANFHRHLMRETASICKFMGQALYRVFGECLLTKIDDRST